MPTDPATDADVDADADPSPVVAAERAADAPAFVDLPDGRRLAYAEFGDPDGVPVFFFHGFPGSRAQGAALAAVAADEGVRVVAPDRPGFGSSDARPGRTLARWPRDVEALADALDVETFAVLGISGGGPYAVACAAGLPERVRAVSLVASVAPLSGTASRSFRLPFQLARFAPPLASLLFWWGGRDSPDDLDAAVEERAADAPPVDAAAWRSPAGRAVVVGARLATRQGVRPLVTEAALYARPWGVDFDAVTAPTFVWHGDADEHVPVSMAHFLADRLDPDAVHVQSDTGHLSVAVTNAAAVLRELRDASRRVHM